MEAFNRFTIKVYAIDIRRGVEGSKYGTLKVYNPPPVMGKIKTYPWMGGGMFTWPSNREMDFLWYRIKSYLVTESNEIGYIIYTEQSTSSYIRQLNQIEKDEGYVGIYIEVIAIDTFGNESYPSRAELVVDSLNIKPTDIEGFALSASKMFSSAIALEGEMFFSNTNNNEYQQGFISWNAHKVFLRGVEFQIMAGSSDKKYIYFKTSRQTYPTLSEAETAHPVEYDCIYYDSNSHPVDDGLIALNFDSGKYGQIVAVNNNGFYDMAWNAIANQVIGSAYIMNGAINDAHIGSLSAGKITAGSAFIGGVSIGGLTTIDVALGAAGELPTMPSMLPEGLYITRDFIGYYQGPYNVSAGTVVKNGSGTITISKGSTIINGVGTNFNSLIRIADPSGQATLFRIAVAVTNATDYGIEAKYLDFSRTDVISDTQINASTASDTDYTGRYMIVSAQVSVYATNVWSYIFKSDGTLALQEGGKLIVGDRNIVIDTEGDTNSIEVAPNGGKAGHDYLLMKDGDLKDFFWNGTTHVQMKSLKNIVVGNCTSGVDCTIAGNFKAPWSGVVAPTIMIMSPASMVSDPNQIHVPFKIVADPGAATYVTGTTWKFHPKIGIEYSGGVWAHKVPTGCSYTTGIPAGVTTSRDLTGSIICPKNTTQVILEFSAQSNMNTDLLGTQTGRFSLKYQRNDDIWVNNGAYLDVSMSNLSLNDYAISVINSVGIKNVILSFTPFYNEVDLQLRGDVSTLSTYINEAYFYENNATAKYIAFGANE